MLTSQKTGRSSREIRRLRLLLRRAKSAAALHARRDVVGAGFEVDSGEVEKKMSALKEALKAVQDEQRTPT